MPYIEVPILNPINVVDKNRVLPANYNWHHFDGWLSYEQATEFEVHKCDAQKWQFNDILFLQFRADYSPIRLQVRDERGLVVLTEVMDVVAVIAGKYYFQAQIAFDDPVFSGGGYFLMEILAGDPVLITLEAVLFNVQDSWPGTMLIKYSHLSNNDILWETGIYMNFRVDGVIPYDGPGSLRTVYTDQPQSQVTVKGDPFRKYKLYIGTEGGVPNWVIDKMEEIIDQNLVDYDGKPFAPAAGATWSTKRIERYPWAQWNIEMREVVNRRAKRFEEDGVQDKKVAIDYIVEGRLFGPIAGSANDNTYTINEIE